MKHIITLEINIPEDGDKTPMNPMDFLGFTREEQEEGKRYFENPPELTGETTKVEYLRSILNLEGYSQRIKDILLISGCLIT